MEQAPAAAQPQAPAAAAAVAPAAILPQPFVEDPAGYLVAIASQLPSRQGLAQLAGPIGQWFIGGHDGCHMVAHQYLQAAAVQLRAEAMASPVVVSANAQQVVMEEEMMKTQNQYDVLEVRRASLCLGFDGGVH